MNRKQRRAEARLSGEGGGAARPVTPIAGWLNTALAYQRAGRAADAERLCRHILSIDPGNAQTLHLLGLLEHQRDRSDDAIAHLRMAITRNGRAST